MSANCLPTQSKNRWSAKEPHAAASDRKNRVRPSRKGQSLRVPPGKIIKAQAMLNRWTFTTGDWPHLAYVRTHSCEGSANGRFCASHQGNAGKTICNRTHRHRIIPSASGDGWISCVRVFERPPNDLHHARPCCNFLSASTPTEIRLRKTGEVCRSCFARRAPADGSKPGAGNRKGVGKGRAGMCGSREIV